MLLRRIFGPKRKKESGSWRKTHNEQLHNLYTSPNIITGHQIKEGEMGRA
jgi:hypothetical protein